MTKKERPLQSILDAYPVFEETDRGKLLCTLTKHELPIAEIEKYVKTKKFLDRWDSHDVLTKYAEHFQELDKGVVACLLTKRSVAKDGKSLRNHVKTDRFLNALAKAEEEKAAKASAEAMEAAADEANGDKATIDVKTEIGDENADPAKQNSDDDDQDQDDNETDEDDEQQNDDDDESSDEEDDEPPKPTPSKQQKVAGKNRRSTAAAAAAVAALKPPVVRLSGDAKKRKIVAKAKQTPKKKANRAK